MQPERKGDISILSTAKGESPVPGSCMEEGMAQNERRMA